MSVTEPEYELEPGETLEDAEIAHERDERPVEELAGEPTDDPAIDAWIWEGGS